MTRQLEFSPTTGDAICELIADGKSLRSICLADDMPSRSTVFKWLDANPEFADQYARAHEAQADLYFEQCIEIADDGKRDYAVDPEGGLVVDHDHIQRSKLRVETRKWAAARLRPKKYGDRVLTQNQALDRDGNPTDPAPVYAISFENGGPGQPVEPVSTHERSAEAQDDGTPSSET